MYPMKEFIRNHKIEIENGAHFVPRLTHSRPLWFYYPTKRFPFFTIEVEEDIFPAYMPKDIFITARGKCIEDNKIVVGDLFKRPMIYFAVENIPEERLQIFTPLFYWCTEIFNKQGKFTVFRDEIEIIKVEDLNGRIIREYNF